MAQGFRRVVAEGTIALQHDAVLLVAQLLDRKILVAGVQDRGEQLGDGAHVLALDASHGLQLVDVLHGQMAVGLASDEIGHRLAHHIVEALDGRIDVTAGEIALRLEQARLRPNLRIQLWRRGRIELGRVLHGLVLHDLFRREVMVVFHEVTLVVWVAFHDELGADITELGAAHQLAVARMPGREDRAAHRTGQREQRHAIVRPHRRHIADPDLLRRLFDILHVETADLVGQIMVLGRGDGGRILVDAEQLKPFVVMANLVAGQHVEPQLVQGLGAAMAERHTGQAREGAAPHLGRQDATPPGGFEGFFGHGSLS